MDTKHVIHNLVMQNIKHETDYDKVYIVKQDRHEQDELKNDEVKFNPQDLQLCCINSIRNNLNLSSDDIDNMNLSRMIKSRYYVLYHQDFIDCLSAQHKLIKSICDLADSICDKYEAWLMKHINTPINEIEDIYNIYSDIFNILRYEDSKEKLHPHFLYIAQTIYDQSEEKDRLLAKHPEFNMFVGKCTFKNPDIRSLMNQNQWNFFFNFIKDADDCCSIKDCIACAKIFYKTRYRYTLEGYKHDIDLYKQKYLPINKS